MNFPVTFKDFGGRETVVMSDHIVGIYHRRTDRGDYYSCIVTDGETNFSTNEAVDDLRKRIEKGRVAAEKRFLQSLVEKLRGEGVHLPSFLKELEEA